MDNELMALVEQKKQIEAQIKALKSQAVYCGCVKFAKDYYPTDRPEGWYIAVKMRTEEGGERWRGIIRSTDKVKVIEKLPEVIADLQGLQKMLEAL